MKIDKDDLKYFADFIESHLGIVYSEVNYFQLEKRLVLIAKFLEKSIEELVVMAHREITGQFKTMLLDIATNNETSFFRDPGIFKAVEDYIVPKLIEQKGSGHKLKIWSAACSTGQEVYTLIMVLNKLVSKGVLSDYDILATDFSQRALKQAQSGEYSHLEIQRGLPALLLIEYFDRDGANGEKWTFKREFSKKVNFKNMNLLESFPVTGQFDIILCRNVLIYQAVENKKDIINRLTGHLDHGGYFLLGAAESLFGLSTSYDQVKEGTATVYRKKLISDARSA